LRAKSRHGAPLYAADLAGGALLVLAVVPLLNWLGGPNTVLSTPCAWPWQEQSGQLTAGAKSAADAPLRAGSDPLNYSGKLFRHVYAKEGSGIPHGSSSRDGTPSRVWGDIMAKGKAIVSMPMRPPT